VYGDVNAQEIDVSGTVEGSLLVGNKLVLRKTAQIIGDIYTKSILMEEGAEFQGECRMGADPLAEKDNWGKKKTSAKNEKAVKTEAAPTAAKKPEEVKKSS
jgi:cytoskeletal protein CcmA (bactofilin family)